MAKSAQKKDAKQSYLKAMLIIAIAGAAALCFMPDLINRADQTKVVVAHAEIKTLERFVLLFKMDHGYLPKSLEQMTKKDQNGRIYLARVPKDPWGKRYFLLRTSDGSFKILPSQGLSDTDKKALHKALNRAM